MSEVSGTVVAAEAPVDGPYLTCAEVSGSRRCWRLVSGVVTIGRALSADVVLDEDLQVSRLHLTLERVAGVWTAVDDGLSRNGTYVNGRRLIGRLALRDRDQLRVGRTVLTFCAPGQDSELRTLVGAPLAAAARLTPAQRGVLVALCRPCAAHRADRDGPSPVPATNQEIADELFLSVDAVKTHLRALFHALGVDALPQNQKRTRLAELALQLGLVSPAELLPARGG